MSAILALAALAACTSGAPETSSGKASALPASVTAGPAATPAVRPQPRPTPAGPRVRVTSLRTPDGSVITIAVFSGAVRYVLHNGSTDPGPLAARLVQAGPRVSGAERPQLLAGFNGGFKMNANAGGYEQEGHVIKPLRAGLASFVIDRSGAARIAVWGNGAPAPGEQVYSVRQNLPPLVLNGRPVRSAADWRAWGATIGGAEYVARSALGEDLAGNLVYVGSMSATPADLATALIHTGALIGMELDINPNWVQLDVSAKPGGALRAEVPGQWRPADQFLLGWDRDFVAVLG